MIERYSRPPLLALWADARRLELFLDVELAACRAMERRGTVPAGTADAVEAKARGKLDAERVRAIGSPRRTPP